MTATADECQCRSCVLARAQNRMNSERMNDEIGQRLADRTPYLIMALVVVVALVGTSIEWALS